MVMQHDCTTRLVIRYDWNFTPGEEQMAAALKVSRVQRKGQITIPLEFRQRLGILEGDYVAFTETEGGILLTHQRVIPAKVIEKMSRVADSLESQLRSAKKR